MRTILIIALIGATLISCKKERTLWNTDWSAPLINDTLSLAGLVNDSTLEESGGNYHLNLKRDLFNVGIAEFIEIPDTTIEESFGIAFAFISVPPGQTFVTSEEEHDLQVKDVELKEIHLSQGFIDVTVANPAETQAIFNVQLPGVSKDGVSFTETYFAPAAANGVPGVVTKTLDLSGYVLDLTGVNGDKRNTFTSKVTVTSDPAGPTVTLTNEDITKVNATFRDVRISYGKGYFGNQIVSDTTKVDLDVLKLIESGMVDLPASTVQVEIENGIKVGAEALITKVSNQNNSGGVVDLANSQIGTSFNINPAVGAWSGLTPSLKVIEFNQSNSNIEAYLENLGNKHEIGYELELNPWGNVSAGTDEIFPQSKIRLGLNVDMPLSIGLDQLIVRDTFDIDLVQDQSKTRVTEGEFRLMAQNAFPFSADVKLILLDANYNVLHTIQGSETIESSLFGTIDPETNLSVKESNVLIPIKAEVVNDLEFIKYVMVESVFNTINPSTNLTDQVTIPVGAFMGIQLRARFTTLNQL